MRPVRPLATRRRAEYKCARWPRTLPLRWHDVYREAELYKAAVRVSEVEARCAQRVAPGQDWPTPRERQVLNYHRKHKTTSPLYERIRAKYPTW